MVKPARALCLFLVLSFLAPLGFGKDFRITIPKRSKPTPVQELNRDGVKAVRKNNIKKAKKLFYKAYLLDPNDPFTLNNLGFIAELEGDLERAQRYYELSATYHSEATIDRSNVEEFEGKTLSAVAGKSEGGQMMVNRLNVEAIQLLSKDRAIEAEALLQKALQIDGKNPFTLNNLGHAREKQGELESAISYYQRAAATNSDERIIVTPDSDWRGRRIRDVAARNVRKVRRLLEEGQDVESQVARLNLRGVVALNRNDRRTARKFFEQAYKLDNDDAFTLNNMGYLAELDGDRETANYYYMRAQEADRASDRVVVATRKDAEGRQMAAVASQNDVKVAQRMLADLEARRRAGGDSRLRRRDGSVVVEPAEPRKPVDEEEPMTYEQKPSLIQRGSPDDTRGQEPPRPPQTPQ